MRSLTSEYRLQALSVPDVTEPFERCVLDMARSEVFLGRKLKPGPVLNALVMHFLDMQATERDRIVGRYLRKLETVLDAEPTPAPGRGLIARRDETEADEKRQRPKRKRS